MVHKIDRRHIYGICLDTETANTIVSMMVILRSRWLGSVRVDMMLGTEQPKPISMGTMLRPDSPTLRSRESVMKAIRAM